MNTSLTALTQKQQSIRALLSRPDVREQIGQALPRHLNADRLLRVAMTSIIKTPRLLDCTQASLLGSIMQAAQLGLEPDGVTGHAYLVPYGTTCQLIPGYRGLVDLARRSGQLADIYAALVYENEKWQYVEGLNRVLEHIPQPPSMRGEKVIAGYAVAALKDGTKASAWMWAEEIDAIRRRSKAANAGPWITDPAEMMKKTVIRRLAKMLPLSVEFFRAAYLEDEEQHNDELVKGIIDVTTEDTKVNPLSIQEITLHLSKDKELAGLHARYGPQNNADTLALWKSGGNDPETIKVILRGMAQADTPAELEDKANDEQAMS